MNIIFLDMDGVINSGKTFRMIKNCPKFKSICIENRCVPYYIDPSLRYKINEILVTVPECKVVWSSSWRLGLKDSKLFIEGFYNKCGFIKDSFLDYTPIVQGFPRYLEILRWLYIKGEKYKINKCIIIDDDVDAEVNIKKLKKELKKYDLLETALKYQPKFFQTNNLFGITDLIKTDILNYFK